jgi:hypothetical protein
VCKWWWNSSGKEIRYYRGWHWRLSHWREGEGGKREKRKRDLQKKVITTNMLCCIFACHSTALIQLPINYDSNSPNQNSLAGHFLVAIKEFEEGRIFTKVPKEFLPFRSDWWIFDSRALPGLYDLDLNVDYFLWPKNVLFSGRSSFAHLSDLKLYKIITSTWWVVRIVSLLRNMVVLVPGMLT